MSPFFDTPSDPPQTEEGLRALVNYFNIHDRIEKLSDAELSEEVLDKVWAHMQWNEQEALLNEMMHRFDKMAGIKRDSEGNIVQEK